MVLIQHEAEELVAAVRERLQSVADPLKAPRMQAYMKSEMPYLGVQSQPLRVACREVFAGHPLPDRPQWEWAVRHLWDEASHREERYAAIALMSHRLYGTYQDMQTLALYRHLVETGAWWDFIDVIASHGVGPILRANPQDVTPLMRSWGRDGHLWVRRTAILCQLSSKNATDTDLLADVVGENLADSRYGNEFFIRKAIGWALREYAKTDPDWVLDFVRRNERGLSPLSRREALKHLDG
ncbi:DNA alkylation repair protein [Arthrobacter sp. 260]|uniref:DNA alkylation repair protein n=1 Tax=Arthrobacter sp. 260 TaxID=2735314 RepID=UPI001492BD5A|nr:DNA alkylation repair protein [Arthrobacter sp. 260]NOJ58741.1 DNA alkylation repair protein [Arthrobacter sp. 260]